MWNDLIAITGEWVTKFDAVAQSGLATSLFTILALSGLLVLLFARRRRGRSPYCRRCGYDQTGRVSDRCSECGANLTHRRAIRIGRPRLSRAWAAAGLLALVAGAVPAGRSGWLAARAYDWYQLKPIPWVLDDLRRPDTRSGDRAVERIARMALADELSDEIATRAIDASLDGRQGADYHGNDWSDFELLGLLYSTRDFSPEQTARLFETFFCLQLEVRNIVRADDPIPIRLGLGPDRSSGLHAFIRTTSLQIDGREIDTRNAGLEWDWGGETMDLLAPSMPPGRHVLTWHTDVLCYDASDGVNSLHLATMQPAADPRARHRFRRSLTAEFEVTPLNAPDPIQLVESPEMAAYLASLSGYDWDLTLWGLVPGWYDADFFARSDPSLPETPKLPQALDIGLSMDVVATTVDGPVLKLTVVSPSPERSWRVVAGDKHSPPPDGPLTIRMSTNRDAAARTLDVYRIWHGTATAQNVRLSGPQWMCGGVRGGDLFQRSQTNAQRSAYLKSAQDRWPR